MVERGFQNVNQSVKYLCDKYHEFEKCSLLYIYVIHSIISAKASYSRLDLYNGMSTQKTPKLDTLS